MKIRAQQASLRTVLVLLSLCSSLIYLLGTENINLPKFVALGVAAGAGFAYWVRFEVRGYWRSHQFFIYALITFATTIAVSCLWSSAPITQNLYGVLGRNTGVVTFLALILIALFTLSLHQKTDFIFLLNLLQISGIINVAYCLWVIIFRNSFGVGDPFIGIDSLLGNPDFISSFLAITLVSVLARALGKEISKLFLTMTVLLAISDFVVMFKLGATQGFVVTIVGFSIVVFYKLRSKFHSPVPSIIFTVSALLVSLVGILGALGRGPLSFLHENSVIFRGWYWNAAITMGSTHPWTGVGLDSYGDWFTRARSLDAATSPLRLIEPNADSAHSVPLDFFASGGWPMMVAYLLILIAVLIVIIRFTRRNRAYDSTFVALTASWFCYQAQSLISLNQLGLAVWGWSLGGALIAYEVMTRDQSSAGQESEKTSKSRQAIKTHPFLTIGVGGLIGFLLTFPPMNSDIQWKRAVDSGNPISGRKALEKNYFNPLTAQEYISAIKIFSASKLPLDALNFSRQGTKIYADNIEIWKLFYELPNISEREKEKIFVNLVRLDSRTYGLKQ